MHDKVMFEKDSKRIKNPSHLQRNVFLLYSPRKIKIEPASCIKIDTEVTAFLSAESTGFVTLKFRSDEINELFHGKYHLWAEILRTILK